jgi:hypothetical protein
MTDTRTLIDTAAITAVLTDYCRFLDRMDLTGAWAGSSRPTRG